MEQIHACMTDILNHPLMHGVADAKPVDQLLGGRWKAADPASIKAVLL